MITEFAAKCKCFFVFFFVFQNIVAILPSDSYNISDMKESEVW